MRQPLDLDETARQIRAGGRAWIARAITLVESSRPDHRRQAQELLTLLGPSPDTMRVGVSGVPGAGKSTFIDALGGRLVDAGHRVAVLAVDPSSTRSGGSILGDKTRMTRLATDPRAFVRPSPSAGTLGGVARATREAMAVLEAAGHDVVLVETVGVGQSETAVAEMVDTFLLLTLARSGDQLQGLKKGVLELADVIAVNKADGPHEIEARRAARELGGALHLLAGSSPAWQPPVLTCSAQQGSGLDEVWAQVLRHRETLDLPGKRRRQLIGWTWSMVRDGLLDQLRDSVPVRELTPRLERQVLAGELTPAAAAEQVLALLRAAERPAVHRETGRAAREPGAAEGRGD
ncbi:methylmalonyl Co-A mutase-associated GTPase MeaB [Kineosporia sp. J2-2]|uniref:Methylmalonyl Co-A mutase-associated GTPase MeaB n=1 Tax=Kineosporia corallincola TaxID=2835133 RepID=A0ABS5TAN9_9ACTN|nr:methylmalonyl Co-A mutase-associated GTPase MeaB [Kineosporia corallincola]MBT0768139.1 methylmalonyl Co-A mutase-associated GTPase MeaB [Kineosporia corallincola]